MYGCKALQLKHMQITEIGHFYRKPVEGNDYSGL